MEEVTLITEEVIMVETGKVFPECPKKCGGVLVPFTASKNGVVKIFGTWKCTNNECGYQVDYPQR